MIEERAMKAGDIVTVEGVVKDVGNKDYVRIVVDCVELVVKCDAIKSVTPIYAVGDHVLTKDGYCGEVVAVSKNSKTVWLDLGGGDMATYKIENIEKKV